MRVSAVVTVRNEERNIRALLESLVVQEPPFEVVVVDAHSNDRTREIVKRFGEDHDFVHLHLQGGTRGAGRNYGVSESSGEAVAFIDGDCIASPFWVHHLREGLRESEIAAGKTMQIGYRPFEDLERVELIYRGYDITFPSCNLAYRRETFDAIGGFDEWFLTAEDIDLNLRGVQRGARISYRDGAIVYNRTRGSTFDFLKQALWNGAGRKQLTLKHGQLWASYRPVEMVRRQHNAWSLLRLAAASLGYVGYKAFGRPRPPSGVS